jgi:hypothetical protein
MQKEDQEEINQSGEFAEENSNLLTKVPTLKRKAKRYAILDTNYWGLICKPHEMVDA